MAAFPDNVKDYSQLRHSLSLLCELALWVAQIGSAISIRDQVSLWDGNGWAAKGLFLALL